MELQDSALLGPMGPLIRQLDHEESSRPLDEITLIRSLKKQLKELYKSLGDLLKVEDPSFTAMCWVKEVRDLCREIEDYFDETVILKITCDFTRFITRVQAVRQRGTSLQLTAGGFKQVTTPDVTLHLPVPCAPIEDIVQLLALDDDKAKQLRVVTLFGFAGALNTRTARFLFDMYEGRFQYRAFVRVSRHPDLRSIFMSILSQIKARPPDSGMSDVNYLIRSMNDHLRYKRYFIVIDDVWTTPVWNDIIGAFPGGHCHSRLITTTQVKHVALSSCDYEFQSVFEMTPLNDGQSGTLFLDRVPGSEGTVEGMKQNLNQIYNKLPPDVKTCLLYFNMYPAGSTIRKHDLVKQWVAEGFSVMGKMHLRERIAGCYFDFLVSKGLIQALDTNCKDEVMACTVQDMVLDIIANKCKELDFITRVTNELETTGHPDEPRRLSVQFRGQVNAKIPKNIELTKVRSLQFSGFYGCLPSLVECRFLQVLILHIWGDRDDATFDLSEISELLLLRYVKVACNTYSRKNQIPCNVSVKLPAKTGELKYLETLEVDARVANLPSSITSLPCLYHLRLPSLNLPVGVTDMTSLRTLGCFDLSINSQENVKKLLQLENMEHLHLTCSSHPVNMQAKMDEIWCSILAPHSSLSSVDLVPTGNYHVNSRDCTFLHIQYSPDDAEASSMSMSMLRNKPATEDPGLVSASQLERLELSPRICIFFSIPWKFKLLGKLSILKIAVREISEQDVDILKGLPALAALSLYVWTIPEERIPLSKYGFPVLMHFKFTCSAPCLDFQEGAMPRVRRLKLRFNASRMGRYSLRNAGFQNLTSLEEISLKVRGDVASCESERIDLESTFTYHSITPIVNVQAVDHIFGSDEIERAHCSSTSLESSLYQLNRGEEQSWKRTDYVHLREAARILLFVTGHKYFNFLQRHMEQMTIIIEQHKEENQGAFQAKWILKLQELVYDIDDFNYKLSLMTTTTLFFSPQMVAVNVLYRMKHLTGRIKALRKWQNDAAQWSKSGESAAAASAPLRYQTLPSYTPESNLVGIDEPKRELMELMSPEDVQLRVISIVGCSGVGKSTLARAVYNSNPGFYKAWVVAADCSSAGDLLDKILHQVVPQDSRNTTRDGNLLRKTMARKRYLLIIDQVQRAEVWYGIQHAFPDGNNGSRIILTTSIKSVAAAAGTTNRTTRSYVYTMQSLGDDDSNRLFWKQFYGRDTESAPVLGNGSENIIRKCDGLPLSLLCMARYLRQHHRMGRIERFGSHIGGAQEGLGEMNNAIDQCYNSLPDNAHRTCLLSLGTFPFGHQIKRKSLIRRWVAEGLVVGDGVRSGDEVAADCFDELFDRNIIEPVLVGNNSRVKRFRVHGLMLEFMVNKAISRNFFTLIRKNEAIPNKQDPLMRRLSISKEPRVRRLSVQDSTADTGRVATEIGLSVVRSLTIFKSAIFDFQGCMLLRILDLEDCKGIDNAVIDVVCQLPILKYLGLRGSDVRRIPKRIRRLQYLETLDLRETDVEKLPIEVIRLPCLAHLFGKFKLPRELKQGKKKGKKIHKFLSERSKLQTLSGFVMDKNNGSECIMLQARYLRKVKIWCNRFSAIPPEDLLVSSLNTRFTGSKALESLSIDLGNHSPDFLHSLQAPCLLSSIKLSGRLGKLPNFIVSTKTTLREVQLSSTGLSCQELCVLQELPYLLYLKLYEDDQWGFRNGVFEVGSGGFPILERLCFQASSIPKLHIKQGAMNKLAYLYLLCPEYPPSCIKGIEYLGHLSEVVLHDSLHANELKVWKEMAMTHQNRPRVAKQAGSS